MLLDRGAEIEAKDSGGRTPLHIATGCGHEAIIGLVLDRGADIEAKDSYERTPLHMFLWYGQEAAIRLLLNRGADIEAKDSNGRTPLDNASLCGHVAMVGLLLNRRADIEARDLGEQTSLLRKRRRPSSSDATRSDGSGHPPTRKTAAMRSPTYGQTKRRRTFRGRVSVTPPEEEGAVAEVVKGIPGPP